MHGLRVASHFRLYLMQFTPAVGHHLNDIMEHVTIPALKLDANHFYVTVGTLQGFHLFQNIKNIVNYKIILYLNI